MKKLCVMLLAVILATGPCALADVSPFTPRRVVTSGDYDYAMRDGLATLVKYNGDDQNVVIPSEIDGYPVAEIGPEAFRYQEMKRVSFPDGIVKIGRDAFEYCEITDVLELPEGVTIGFEAFEYARLPAAVTIPAGATVEQGAFGYCKGMAQLDIGRGVTINARAFQYCDDLARVTCAAGCRLREYAFTDCPGIKQVVLGRDVEGAPDAFHYCGAPELKTAEEPEPTATPAPEAEKARVLEIIDSPASLKGITVTLEKATAVREKRPEAYTYTLAGTLENNSDEEIMRVIYTFALIDENGEEFRSFGEVFDGEEDALPPHTKIDFLHDDIKWGKQSVPAAVRVGISSVQTKSELPPVRLPRTGEYLCEALGDEKLANIRNEMPAELLFHVDQGGYGRTAVFTEGEGLEKAVALLCDIKIGAESGEWVTDNYNWISLKWADGSTTGISLNLYSLEYYAHSRPHTYRLENLEPFWTYCADHLEEDW